MSCRKADFDRRVAGGGGRVPASGLARARSGLAWRSELVVKGGIVGGRGVRELAGGDESVKGAGAAPLPGTRRGGGVSDCRCVYHDNPTRLGSGPPSWPPAVRGGAGQ